MRRFASRREALLGKHSSTSAVSSSGNDDHIPCYITEEKALTMIKEIGKCIADEKFYPDEKVAQVAKLRPSKSFLDDINTLLHRFHCKNDRDRLMKDFFSKMYGSWKEYFKPCDDHKAVFMMLVYLPWCKIKILKCTVKKRYID